MAAELIAKIIGTSNTRSANPIQTRQKNLGPILGQHARIGEARKRRRPVTDVDPKTGDVQPMPPIAPIEPEPPNR